ncbi:MAG: flagella synthesis protein FlgN [Pseudomonadota bacterium]
MASPTLLPILKDIAAHLSALQETLQAEYQALSDNDRQGIEQAARDKSRLTALLDDLEQERVTLLREAGLDLDRSGVMAYLGRQQNNSADPLAGVWQEIEQLSRECEQQNRINGIIIEQNRKRTETALNILQGQSGNTELYSSSGNAVSASNRQSIATKA